MLVYREQPRQIIVGLNRDSSQIIQHLEVYKLITCFLVLLLLTSHFFCKKFVNIWQFYVQASYNCHFCNC
jgi:hypothetical protein